MPENQPNPDLKKEQMSQKQKKHEPIKLLSIDPNVLYYEEHNLDAAHKLG